MKIANRERSERRPHRDSLASGEDPWAIHRVTSKQELGPRACLGGDPIRNRGSMRLHCQYLREMSTHEFAFFNSSLQFHIYFALMRQNMGSNQIIDWFEWKTLRRCLVGRQGRMGWFCLWFWNRTNLFCVWLRREWTDPFLVGIGTPKSI